MYVTICFKSKMTGNYIRINRKDDSYRNKASCFGLTYLFY